MGLAGFNLLKKQKEPPTTWEKIYAWVLGTVRVIVIIVQILVVGSFVARVVIDTQAKNLDKELEKREKTLGGFSETEERYRTIQQRSSNYRGIWENSSSYADQMSEIDNALIGNYTTLNVIVDEGNLVIRGEADINNIGQLEDRIKSSDSFTNVETFELESGSSKGDRRASFGIRAIILKHNTREINQSSQQVTRTNGT